MKAETPEKYLELDAVSDGENLGTIYKCYSRTQKQYFLSVKIQRGPRAGEWEQPWRFGEPLIHWSEAGPSARCERCHRYFRQSLALSADHREARCRTCTSVHDRATRAREQSYAEGLDAGERRDLLRRPWRLTETKRSRDTGE